MTDKTQSCGFIALLGKPNAGKSTLMNRLVGQKLAIVTPKAQTTRSRITGVCIHETQEHGALLEAQMIFVDVPGVFAPKEKDKFERAMVEAAWSGAADADHVLLLVDSQKGIDDELEEVLKRANTINKPTSLILNKIDLINKNELLELTAQLNAMLTFEATYMISALKGDGVKTLKDEVAKLLPKSPWLYPEDQLTDIPMRLLASEITREKCFFRLDKELPYSMTVETESWEERADGSVAIHQNIFVQREGQKGIVLGKGGANLKQIGADARRDMSRQFDCKVHLFLFVKVREGWKDNPEMYSYLGLKH